LLFLVLTHVNWNISDTCELRVQCRVKWLWAEIHREKSNKMQQCIKFYYSIIIWSSTCFGRHTAHYQAHTVPDNVHQLHVQTTCHVWKTRGCQCSFRLLLMDGVAPETCWASYNYGKIKFDTMLHLVGYFFMNCTMLHGSTNVKFMNRKFEHEGRTEFCMNSVSNNVSVW
jgi:hypothetical protein